MYQSLSARLWIGIVVTALMGASVAVRAADDTPFQIQYSTHPLQTKIAFSNSGASSTVAFPQNGALCANLYTYDTAGSMVDCCSVVVGANDLQVFNIRGGLVGGTNASQRLPRSVVIKVMASTGSAGICNASTVGTGSNVLATGMMFWKEVGSNSVPFTPATLSAAELTGINGQCAVLHAAARTCGQP